MPFRSFFRRGPEGPRTPQSWEGQEKHGLTETAIEFINKITDKTFTTERGHGLLLNIHHREKDILVNTSAGDIIGSKEEGFSSIPTVQQEGPTVSVSLQFTEWGEMVRATVWWKDGEEYRLMRITPLWEQKGAMVCVGKTDAFFGKPFSDKMKIHNIKLPHSFWEKWGKVAEQVWNQTSEQERPEEPIRLPAEAFTEMLKALEPVLRESA